MHPSTMIDNHYRQRIRQLLADLGLDPATWQPTLPLQPEAIHLVEVGPDAFHRPLRLTPETAQQWHAMFLAAHHEGIMLEAVSGYRSVDYQYQLIQRKRAAGRTLADILQVNAPPGYSEHHTGRALDLNTPGCEPLEETFEHTDAFRWLTEHAQGFGFAMSYPRDNPAGIVYEPWHWALRDKL